MSVRSSVGEALYGLPAGLRSRLPRGVREAMRRRTGPFAPWEAGFRRDPPPLGPGEGSGAPDFVGIGAQKAGTTWWFGLVVAHPGVSHRDTIHKERHFFTPFATKEFTVRDVEVYHAWFPRVSGTTTGEWTPDYAYQAWVPPLLAKAAPKAKLLMLVRDPVERFRSGLAHSGLNRASLLGDVLAEAVARGFYSAALRRWMAFFEPQQVLVLQYERCVADPLGQIALTYRFLGLPEGFVPALHGRRVSETRTSRVRLDREAQRRLVDLYSADVEELSQLVPSFDRSLWPNFEAL